jgi:hypothetical protein
VEVLELGQGSFFRHGSSLGQGLGQASWPREQSATCRLPKAFGVTAKPSPQSLFDNTKTFGAESHAPIHAVCRP